MTAMRVVPIRLFPHRTQHVPDANVRVRRAIFRRYDAALPSSAQTRQAMSITITQQRDYQFLVDFSKAIPDLLTDEPAPLGTGTGPSPSDMLLAGVANCLTASLLFAVRKFKQDAGGIRATATAVTERNENKRLRITSIDVAITLGAPGADIDSLDRILSQFEDFCTVSQSVQQGIPMTVTVDDGLGTRLRG